MGKKILIADDSASIRSMLSLILKMEGYEVTEASDGQDALSKLKSSKFDLIISDFNMPNMNGLELIKSVKADPLLKFIPIVMLTTEIKDEKKKLGQEAGVKAWVVKPVKPDTLMSVVKKIIG